MQQLVSSMTKKGQVTIPSDIRKLLGLRPHDKVAFVVEDNQVWIRAAISVAERTAGMLKSDQPMLSIKEETEAAEQAMADEADNKERQGFYKAREERRT